MEGELKKMDEKEIHEGTLEVNVTCFNPNDLHNYLNSETLPNDFFEKHQGLKPGDTVKYKINEHTGDIVILGKVEITKTVIPIKN